MGAARRRAAAQEAEVVRAGVEGLDDGDVAHGEGGFAVSEVVAPLAHETVVEAEGEDLLGAVAEIVVPETEGASVVGAEVVDLVEDEAAGAGEEVVDAVEREEE